MRCDADQFVKITVKRLLMSKKGNVRISRAQSAVSALSLNVSSESRVSSVRRESLCAARHAQRFGGVGDRAGRGVA